jgi:hypothetical protein
MAGHGKPNPMGGNGYSMRSERNTSSVKLTSPAITTAKMMASQTLRPAAR